MVAYATREDVYKHGLPRGAVIGRARPVASVDAASNRLALEGHGLSTDTAIQFVADDGGSLPTPLSAATVYYARPVSGSDSLFEVAASEGGAAVDLTTAGTLPFSMLVPVGPQLDALLEVYSRWVDGKAIGHEVPFTSPYPAWVTHAVAVRAAAHAARVAGLGGQAERLFEAETMLLRDIDAMAKGVPLRDAAATERRNLAVGRTPSATRRGEELIG